MRIFLPIFCWLLPTITLPQVKDLPATKDSAGRMATAVGIKPEIFTSGFIDIMNNGQVNASARFIRLFMGEPGKFAIPLSMYSGVSANNFQQSSTGNQKSNDHLVNAYINPLSGLINISSDGLLYFSKTAKCTKAGMLYHFGERVLTGYKAGPITDPQTGKPINFLNSFATAGLYFQTGAWERNNSKNIGIFWLVIRYHSCLTNPGRIKNFLPDIKTNGIYLGYSAGAGIEINNLINFKAIYYQYTKPPEIVYFLPIYQFSFNYSMR
jgi:hypothetical protein